MSDFQGFRYPSSNFFRLPNEWFDITHNMTLAELKVVEYVLRHTWGFQENIKRISLVEFENGRKTREGEHLDHGTGLSRPSIRKGLQLAVEHGFLVVHKEGDPGRQRHLYGPNMNEEEGVKNLYSAGKENCPPQVNKLPTLGKKITPVHRKKPGKERCRGKTPTTFTSSEFDERAAAHLRALLVKHGSDLVNGVNRTKLTTFAKSITNIRLERKVPEDEIKAVIKWLEQNYDGTYTPKLRKADDLYSNWGRFRDARIRWLADNGFEDDPASGITDVNDVFNELQVMGCSLDFDQEDVDDASLSLGIPAGTFAVEDIPA